MCRALLRAEQAEQERTEEAAAAEAMRRSRASALIQEAWRDLLACRRLKVTFIL